MFRREDPMASWDLLFRAVIPKRVKYTRSIISYLDILGFQDLIEKKTAGEMSQLLRILAESGAGDGIRIRVRSWDRARRVFAALQRKRQTEMGYKRSAVRCPAPPSA
jgi:hypothetical protein